LATNAINAAMEPEQENTSDQLWLRTYHDTTTSHCYGYSHCWINYCDVTVKSNISLFCMHRVVIVLFRHWHGLLDIFINGICSSKKCNYYFVNGVSPYISHITKYTGLRQFEKCYYVISQCFYLTAQTLTSDISISGDTPLTIKVTDTHKSYCQKNGHVSL
jgi:hypothetical protein